MARGLRAKSNFPNHFKLICPVQSSPKKYSAFAVGQISDLNPPVSPDKRGGSRSSRNARWDAVDAGGDADESADLRTAKSCGPDAPMLASSRVERSARRRWQESPVTGESAE